MHILSQEHCLKVRPIGQKLNYDNKNDADNLQHHFYYQLDFNVNYLKSTEYSFYVC